MNYKIVEKKEQKPLKIVLCIPGTEFSGNFVECLLEFVNSCNRNNIQVNLARGESSMVHFARAKCLGSNTLRGKNQKPFDGKLAYDYLLWIDSDIVFNFSHLVQLLNRKVNIVGGLYAMSDIQNFAAVEKWDVEYYKQNGCFKFMNIKEIEGKKDLIEVAYTGFGFLLVKYGVFESLQYPYFKSLDEKITPEIVDIASEDTSWCKMVKQKGFKVYVDPLVRVGHEKKVIL